jgi:RNase P subunit RPR2
MLSKDLRKFVFNLKAKTKMAICPNCKSKLSCGCQKRTASDGKQVCSNCMTAYQKSLNKK